MACSALTAGVNGLVLTQHHVPDFVDFPWKPLNVGRSDGCGREGSRGNGGVAGEQEGELGLKCKIKFKNK